MDISMMKRLIQIQSARKDLEKQVEAMKEEERTLMDVLIPQFESDGIQKMTVDNKTLFIKRELWAGLADGFEHQDGVAALKAAGLLEFVDEKFNSRTVSSYFREREKQIEKGTLNEELIPDAMRGVFVTNEKFSIGITNG